MMNQTMIVAGIAASAAFTKNITSRPNGISMSEIVMPAGPDGASGSLDRAGLGCAHGLASQQGWEWIGGGG